MIKLTAISYDNLNHEHEGINFFYGEILMFKQYGKYLNRGGRGLNFKNVATNEVILSCGKYTTLNPWLSKVTKHLKELGFEISAEEIKEAIKERQKVNVESRNKEVMDLIKWREISIKEAHLSIMNWQKEIKQLKSKLTS